MNLDEIKADLAYLDETSGPEFDDAEMTKTADTVTRLIETSLPECLAEIKRLRRKLTFIAEMASVHTIAVPAVQLWPVVQEFGSTPHLYTKTQIADAVQYAAEHDHIIGITHEGDTTS